MSEPADESVEDSSALARIAEPPATEIASRPEVSPATRKFRRHSKADRTRVLYTQHWSLFEAYCQRLDRSALPALPETVQDYLSFLAEHGPYGRPWKPATIDLALAVISKCHRVARLPSPRDDEDVQDTLEGIRRTLGTAQRRVDAAVLPVLRRFVEVLPSSLLGVRDQALLMVGFAAAFRRSELVALDVADLQFEETGLIIHVRRSKTDQVAEGQATGLKYGDSPATCPIRTVQRWLEASGIKEGAVFRAVNRHGGLGGRLHSREVARVVKRTAAAAGFDAGRFSGHSLRAGFVTTAGKAGKAREKIRQQGRWQSSSSMDRYFRDQELLGDDNASDGIGM